MSRRRSCSSRRGEVCSALFDNTLSPRQSKTQHEHRLSVEVGQKRMIKRRQTVGSVRSNCYFDLLDPLIVVGAGATKVGLGLGRVLRRREPPTFKSFW